jgi:hypothetical protein
MKPIEGYASVASVSPSAAIQFSVRIESPAPSRFQIDFYRKGNKEVIMKGYGVTASAQAYSTPDNASSVGCGWPVAYTLMIPDDWQTGVYVARLTTLEVTPVAQTDVVFIVKTAVPGERHQTFRYGSVSATPESTTGSRSRNSATGDRLPLMA